MSEISDIIKFNFKYHGKTYKMSIRKSIYDHVRRNLRNVFGKYYDWFRKGYFRIGEDVLSLMKMGLFNIEIIDAIAENDNSKFELVLASSDDYCLNVILTGLLRDAALKIGNTDEIEFRDFAREVRRFAKHVKLNYDKVLIVDKKYIEPLLIGIKYPVTIRLKDTRLCYLRIHKDILMNCPSLMHGVSYVEVAYSKYQGGLTD
ncbi:MAG: hypothetical protein GXO43_03820 [Crenarchaeota archaeon]|nr:hypothetical protein [Thermoproteota archaeon]